MILVAIISSGMIPVMVIIYSTLLLNFAQDESAKKILNCPEKAPEAEYPYKLIRS